MTLRVEGGQSYAQTFDVQNRLTQVVAGGTLTSSYVYDADGGMLKRVRPDGTATVYAGIVEYELTVTGTVSATTSYYDLPGARVVRVNSTLSYVLTDHLGSSSVTLDGNGDAVGELRYYAFGETRVSSGSTPSERLYTGQLRQADLGLDYFNSRWYVPSLNRWLQPDTIIPNLANSQRLNRYSFVRNNPIRYTDPSGHRECEDRDSCGAVRYRRIAPNWAAVGALYNIKFTGTWTNADMRNTLLGVIAVGSQLAATTQQPDTASQAFRASYGLSQSNPMVFDMYDGSVCGEGCWGRTNGSNSIRFYRFFNEVDDAGNTIIGADGQPIRGTTTMSPRLTAHELGHAFNASASNLDAVVNTPYESLKNTWDGDPTFPRRRNGGFAGTFPGWQQRLDETESEEFADMFVGWTFNTWGAGDAGNRRSGWMASNMSDWLTVMVPPK